MILHALHVAKGRGGALHLHRNCTCLGSTPPHPTPAFAFNVMAFPFNVMAFPFNGMAFPVTGRSHGLALGAKKVARDLGTPFH